MSKRDKENPIEDVDDFRDASSFYNEMMASEFDDAVDDDDFLNAMSRMSDGESISS